MGISLGSVVNLDLFQTNHLVDMQTLGAGTYDRNMLIEGNSILSSVYVKAIDPGATIKVNYWDSSAGSPANERYNLQSHNLISSALTDRILVTRIHNKPNLEIIITGGDVTFGVYITVVNSFASDMDAALVNDGETFDAVLNQGMIAAGYDETLGILKFLRMENGRLLVSSTEELVDNPTIANVSLPTANTEVSYAFPANTKEFYLQNRENGLIKFSYTATESGTLYKTLWPGGVLTRERLSKDNLTIYLQSPLASQVVEVVSWR